MNCTVVFKHSTNNLEKALGTRLDQRSRSILQAKKSSKEQNSGEVKGAEADIWEEVENYPENWLSSLKDEIANVPSATSLWPSLQGLLQQALALTAS